MLKEYSRVYAGIDLDAIVSNVEEMKKNLSAHTNIMAVIKADGYGHGAVPIARELESISYIEGFAVATVEEAISLKKAGIQKKVLILGYTFPDAFETLIQYGIRQTVFEEQSLKGLSQEAKRQNKKAYVHVKIDTGMGRIGLPPVSDSIPFFKMAEELPDIETEGIFTHFARADETDKTAARKQLQSFQSFIGMLKKQGISIPLMHCSNSAGIVELPEANMDMVRAGIILYGLWPSEQIKQNIIRLIPVLSLKSKIVHIKEVPAGTPISYGGTFVTTRDMTRIATIPVGYADGYPRTLSGKGAVLINGKRAPILGRICMDQFMVDITDIPGVLMHDEVTLIGIDGEEHMTAEELGALSGRFNYELVCNINKRVPRIYFKKGEPVFSIDNNPY